MESYNQIYKHQQNTEIDIKINLTVLGIFLFTFYVSITKSFLPFNVTILFLLSSIVFIVFGKLISKKGITFTRVDVLWFLFYILFVLNISFNNLINRQTIVDISVYTTALLFLLFVKVNIDYYSSSLKLIKLMGIVYAISAVFHYVFTDEYLSYILPLFELEEQIEVLELQRNNSYTGFTNQTAHLAGYILSAIGVIIFSSKKEKFSAKLISILLLILLIYGLLLSAKRAHLIFTIIAILLTYLFSINNKRIVQNTIRLLSGAIVAIIIAIFLYNSIDNDSDSPIVDFIEELEYTIVGLLEGEDVSNGRITLYRYSWELFKEKPITGIGWKEFRENSIGLINNEKGSHPHNIYLQLLTELGIIGFLLFMIPVMYVYYKTFLLLRFLIKDNFFKNWKFGIQFSFFTQTFFVLYGLTGNLLTDFNFLLIYFLSVSITMSALVKLELIDKKFGGAESVN